MDQHRAAYFGDIERVQQLVNNINKDEPQALGLTVLHYACMGGHDYIVKWLLQMEANINARQDAGNTLLVYSAAYSRPSCMQLLLDAGADASVTNIDGKISLHWAYHSAECTALLIAAYPAGVNAIDTNGCAPLHKTAQYGTLTVCSLLLDAGSIIDVMNSEGYTPLYYALRSDKRDAAELLIDRGAKLELVKLNEYLEEIPDWALEFVARRKACEDISKVVTLLRIPGMDPQLFKVMGKYVWNTRKNKNWGK